MITLFKNAIEILGCRQSIREVDKKNHFEIIYIDVYQIWYVVGQLATHQQVLNQFGGMFTLFAGRFEEEFRETRTIDCVSGEMGAHGQVLHRCIDFSLDLATHLFDAATAHVQKFIGNIGLLFGACLKKARQKN